MAGDDSLSDVHMGGGNAIFFDGHAEFILRTQWLKKMSTTQGTLEVVGGYIGFTW